MGKEGGRLLSMLWEGSSKEEEEEEGEEGRRWLCWQLLC